MKEIASKRELLERASFDANVRYYKGLGARLTPQQIEFLGEALWQGYRSTVAHPVRAMKDAQRGLKKSVVDGAGSSLADLGVLVGLLRGRFWATPSWFTLKDIRRALPPQRIQELVSELAWIGDREYADPMLAVLRPIYAKRGERIVIIREP